MCLMNEFLEGDIKNAVELVDKPIIIDTILFESE